MKIQLKFVPQDLWIGLFWKKSEKLERYGTKVHPMMVLHVKTEVWICLLPCIPIYITWNTAKEN